MHYGKSAPNVDEFKGDEIWIAIEETCFVSFTNFEGMESVESAPSK